jgi:hypothetical protein
MLAATSAQIQISSVQNAALPGSQMLPIEKYRTAGAAAAQQRAWVGCAPL